MIKYDKYKPSCIHWLGDIPNNWELKRVKDTSNTKSGTTPLSGNKDYYENGIYNWVRTTDLNDGELYEVEYKITQLALDECRLSFLPLDTILVAMYGGFGTIGKNSILKKSSTINQSVCAIIPSRKLNSNYFMYFLKYFRADWKLFADGARKDPNINQDAVKNLFILYPPLVEQSAIAQFLDIKTKAIDKKTDLLSQKIIYYKELRKSIIKEAVFKGIEKQVNLKESKIEYVGAIPQNWVISRGKNLFIEYPKSKITANEGDEEGKYKFFTSSNEQSKWLNYFQMNNEAILFSTGGCAGINYCQNEYSYSTDVWALYGRKNVHLKYYYYYFETILNEIQQKGFKGSSLEHLQKDFIKASEIIVPSTKLEQSAIANYLDVKTQIIDAVIANLSRQIETLKELRTSLISDVVTGKLKVTK